MASETGQPYLKYALFCRETDEQPGDRLVLKDLVDLVRLPFMPAVLKELCRRKFEAYTRNL